MTTETVTKDWKQGICRGITLAGICSLAPLHARQIIRKTKFSEHLRKPCRWPRIRDLAWIIVSGMFT